MKKIMMLLIAVVMLFSVTGQAMAAFNEGDLIRVVYNTSNDPVSGAHYFEYATDLGAFQPTSLSGMTANTDAFNTSSVGGASGTATFSQMNVAYFIMNSSGYAASTSASGNINTYAFWGSYQPAASNTLGTFAAAAVGNNAKVAMDSGYSYWTQMNGGGTMIGTMGNYLATGDAEKSLAALSTTGYVDQILYYYGADPDSGIKGTKASYIRTFADGHTTVSAIDPSLPSVPIPAAIYLFGSGLMGLVGLRRKTAA